ncbi:MAG: hypothetical protein ABL897_16135 [Hyphomicrobium sp.]
MNITVPPPHSAQSPVREHELLEYATRLAHQRRNDRLALHLHFSQLHANYQRPDYIRIATEIFQHLISQFDGKIFVLNNHDILFVARNANQAMLDIPVNRIRMLFSEDHLIHSDNDPESGFVSWFHLDRDYDRFLRVCHQLFESAEAQLRHDDFFAQMVLRPEEKPLKVWQLAKLEEGISQADLSSVIRKQAVCAIVPGRAPEALFDEIYVSINDLRTVTAPQLNLLGDRWLFQYLTQTLDQRVLAYLQDPKLRHERPFSLNLNVATVLSADFQRFNETVATNLRKTLVLEFNKIDVFSDLGAFIFARDYLHEYGYRLCLDGMSHLTLPFFDRQKLGFDLVKLNWNPDGIAHLHPAQIPEIRQMIMAVDQARVILCRCESAQAVRMGQELGLLMFQGREIDRLLATATAHGGKSGPIR